MMNQTSNQFSLPPQWSWEEFGVAKRRLPNGTILRAALNAPHWVGEVWVDNRRTKRWELPANTAYGACVAVSAWHESIAKGDHLTRR